MDEPKKKAAPRKNRRAVQQRAFQVGDTLRRRLEDAPAITRVAAKLPKIEGVRLEGLVAKVPEIPSPTTTDVERVLRQRQRAHASSALRERGDEVALHDEILVDVMTYRNGALVPFSIRQDLVLVVDPLLDEGAFAGYGLAALGAKVGAAHVVNVDASAEHDDARVRGQNLRLAMVVKAARAFSLPELDALVELEGASDQSALLDQCVERLSDQRADEAIRKAQAELVRTLFGRSTVTIEDAHVDDVITERWRRAEGELLIAQGVDASEQDQLLLRWKQSATERERAKNALMTRLVLDGVIEREKISASEQEIEDAISATSSALGIKLEARASALTREHAAQGVKDYKAMSAIVGAASIT